jgi:hypothetical protein
MTESSQSSGRVPELGRKPFDWLRIVILVSVFGALTYAVVTRYTGKTRGEPYREPLRAFFAAARTRDSLRLRTMVSADPPLRWALAAATQVPSPIPRAEDPVDVQGLDRRGDTTSLMVWAATACGRQPFFITMVSQAGRQRVLDLRTECDSSTRHDSAGRP